MSYRIDNENYGVGRVGGDGNQGLMKESSTPKHPIGEKIEVSDGRCFRYAKFETATAASYLVSQDVSATCIVETDGKLIVGSGDGSSNAIGSTVVRWLDSGTVGSATANQYAGGYLHTTDDTGEAYQYRIKTNTAASSNSILITLYDPLVVACSASTDAAITGNLWNRVHAATPTDYIVSGVSLRAVTVDYYAWVQTAGLATVLSNGAIPIGSNVTLSDDVAGAVQAKDAETEPQVGFAAYLSDDTGHVGVVLNGLVP